MAQMLNYFLKFLFGSERKDFGVKDKDEFEFKPADLVRDICLIYIHLSSEENPKSDAFCRAVATDARSYSSGLLKLAAEVLIRTMKSGDGLAEKMTELSVLTDRLAREIENMEIPSEDVPERFTCSLMCSLMLDPVELPSGNIVDRSSIARHLLSDQMDPFNRQPMTMGMVKELKELKAEIDEFVASYKQN